MNRYAGHFGDADIDELIRLLNSQCSNPGAGAARIEFDLELAAELKRRGIECSALNVSGGEFSVVDNRLIRTQKRPNP